ncbi:hypothetical protein BDV96DRAFT_500757 [Lophiotrema nucula]|uniref:Uncharacterized protein n=1 Tax=Lophiotrema nucula TaxID=690887 RepID=A0A6A5YU85_9PLEO|nr:hypothetical protein BDV96DRAFT_500757 [Lophiotrema nucula]
MTTSFTNPTPSNSTASTSAHTTKGLAPPLGIPPASTGSDPTTRRNESVFNYYFLFLAAFGVLVAVGLWWLHRRRKRRKELMRLSGQNALARDLDGWVNSRRWMYGRWRHNQAAAFVRQEEGLDENGEAPPPYQPKGETTVSQSNATPDRQATNDIMIPLRTLSRDEIERTRPPEYRALEADHPRLNSNPLETATTQMTQSETAGTHPIASTRDLIEQERGPPND